MNATEENEQEEIEMDIINKLYTFVENGGRLEKGREPVYGEPFYHDYMYQLIKLKYEIGDRLRIESEDGTIEGIMISFCNYEITLLTCGLSLHYQFRKTDVVKIWSYQSCEDGGWKPSIWTTEDASEENYLGVLMEGEINRFDSIITPMPDKLNRLCI